MIIFTALMLLLIAFAVLLAITVTVGVGGAAFIVVFADWIVFALIIGLIVKWVLAKRH